MKKESRSAFSRIHGFTEDGVSLLEVMIAMSIVVIMMSIVFHNLSLAVKKASLESYLQELSSGIKLSRAQAMKNGKRAQVVIVEAGGSKIDFNSDGSGEYFLIFLDDITNNNSFDAGETVIAYSNWKEVTVTLNSFQSCTSIANAKCLTVTSLGIVTENSFPAGGGEMELRIKYPNISNEFCLLVSAMVASASVGEVKGGICVLR